MSQGATTLLAIETSCDETGVAIIEKKDEHITIRASALASQIDIHKETGGVVPEVAAREHTKVIRPLLEKVMEDSRTTPSELTAIAVTVGPGLQPALAVGVNAARTLAYIWQKPVVPVHHIEGHIYSALLTPESSSNYTMPPVTFPVLALIVSGGHTLLVRLNGQVAYQVIGTTLDDAAGEAFDKVARLLNLPYPGGPELSRLAARGNASAFSFPRPMQNSPDHNFSFSGLKTAVFYQLRQLPNPSPAAHADIAASFQQAVIDVLVKKTVTAAQQEHASRVLLAGGVAANRPLRSQLESALDQISIPLAAAPLAICSDNAVMIGLAAAFAWEAGRLTSWREIDALARTNIETFSR